VKIIERLEESMWVRILTKMVWQWLDLEKRTNIIFWD